MDWRELEAFLTLAEELHFGRTAERLHVSRARVSQMIKVLERRVGGPLFDRTSRRVTLTPIGRQLRQDLTPHYRGIHQAIAKAADAARGIGGVLRVGFSSPLASEMVMKIVNDFRVRHPDCEVQIREVHLSNPFGPLRRGDLDIQLTEFPVDEPDLSTGPVLFTDSKVLAVSSRHPLARRETVRVEDLADELVLFLSGLPDYFVDQLIPQRAPSGKPIRRSLTIQYWQELLTLVGAGKGVAVAVAQGARYYPRPDLVYIPIEDASPLGYGLVWRTAGVTLKSGAFAQMALDCASG